jgi:hypothetical protein
MGSTSVPSRSLRLCGSILPDPKTLWRYGMAVAKSAGQSICLRCLAFLQPLWANALPLQEVNIRLADYATALGAMVFQRAQNSQTVL